MGHTGCGGAAACVAAAPKYSGTGDVVVIEDYPHDAPLNKWLTPLTLLAHKMSLPDKPEALRMLVEENIRVQVANLSKSETVLQSKAKGFGIPGQGVWVHGWIYEVETGKLVDMNISSAPAA